MNRFKNIALFVMCDRSGSCIYPWSTGIDICSEPYSHVYSSHYIGNVQFYQVYPNIVELMSPLSMNEGNGKIVDSARPQSPDA